MLPTLPHLQNATRSARTAPLPDVRRLLGVAEEGLAAWSLVVMMLLPLAEILVRRAFTTGIPGAGSIVQHLTLWVGFLGAALAARDDRLLAIATGMMLPERFRVPARVFAATVTVAVVTML
ncbi:MAG: TRAP transporter small permease subunit, partial [Acidobacteriota bacterium]